MVNVRADSSLCVPEPKHLRYIFYIFYAQNERNVSTILSVGWLVDVYTFFFLRTYIFSELLSFCWNEMWKKREREKRQRRIKSARSYCIVYISLLYAIHSFDSFYTFAISTLKFLLFSLSVFARLFRRFVHFHSIRPFDGFVHCAHSTHSVPDVHIDIFCVCEFILYTFFSVPSVCSFLVVLPLLVVSYKI